MKSKIGLTLAAIALFLIFLVAYLPANQVLGRITLPSNLHIAGVSGTLWSGNATRVTVNGLPIKRVEWQLRAIPLLWGTVMLDVSAGNNRAVDEISFEGEITTRLTDTSNISSDDFIIFLPTDQVLANVALPLPVIAGGRFRVIVDELDFDQQCQSLVAYGEWLNASVAGTQGPIDLGTFSALLGCEDNAIVATVEEPNRLGLTLRATMAGLRNIRVTGQFKPDPELPEEVHQAARFFGQPDAQGYFPIKL
ncbi:type II secretion system protein N [Alteromonas oceanisediminis]|uniref:type II secretion system protein N n=1 Tax=Alteromonas oceanisediminis TaxID=2836180 RepID=UPI001BD94BCF|nr:type II secretion system protein N [Alteromonas oceanisediminis]MBT0587862.1 type II secretion system protein N [Alteromonas oceanisediminis]